MSIRFRVVAGLAIVSVLIPASAWGEDYPLPSSYRYGSSLRGYDPGPERIAQRERIARSSASTYDYAYDPYTFGPRGYSRQNYSPYGLDRYKYANPDELAAGLGQQPAIPDTVYGYVEPEDSLAEPTRQENLIYGYYYDPESGDLEHGWHHDRPQATYRARPLPDGQAGARLPEARFRERPPEPRGARILRFEGEVAGISTITGRTDNLMHLIVQVQQPDGTYQAVGLGPFASTNVRKGDWVRGEGTLETLRGVPTVMAEVVSIEGQWFNIRQHAPRTARNYMGEIVLLRSFRPRGSREAQTIAEVHVGDGEVVPVLLGPTRELPTSRLRVGDLVTFWARRGALDNLLVAEQLRVQDETVNVSPDVDFEALGLR